MLSSFRNLTRMLLLAATAVAMLLLVSGPALAQAPEAPPAAAPAGSTPEVPAAHTEEASKGGLMDPDLGTAFFTILIFVALLIVLRLIAWKPILAGLKGREKAIRDSIEAAQRAKADADNTTRALEAKMAEVQRQAAEELNRAKADALKIADTIRAAAEAESAALKDRAVRDIDSAKQQALSEINSHAAELGTAVARKILQRHITPDDQQRLVDESLAEMAKKN